MDAGTYELESERFFNPGNNNSAFKRTGGMKRHDGKYLYDCQFNITIIYSLDDLKLLETIHLFASGATCVNNKFYFLEDDQITMPIADENGVVSMEIILPSSGKYISNNGSNKIIITCYDNKVVSYNADTRKIDTIPTPSVHEMKKCVLMGGEEYCMIVRIDFCCKIVKFVQGSITKSYDCGNSEDNDICSNGGGWVVVLDKEKKMVIILDGDLEVVSSFKADIAVHNRISMDSEWNIYLSSSNVLSSTTIRKYKLICFPQ